MVFRKIEINRDIIIGCYQRECYERDILIFHLYVDKYIAEQEKQHYFKTMFAM